MITRTLGCVLLLLALLIQSARADSPEELADLDGLRQAAAVYLDGYLDSDRLTADSLGEGVRHILDTGTGQLPGILRRAVRSGVLLLAVALLCGLTDSMRESVLSASELDPVRLAGAAAVAAIAAADVNALMGLGRQAMEQMDGFSKLLLPAVTAACGIAGAPAAAAARQAVTLMFAALLLSLATGLLIPLIYAYTAAVTAYAALGNEGLKRVGALLKWTVTGLLSFLLTGYVLALTLSGSMAGQTDVVARKAAKTALSGMVPVVGKILADAAEAVVAGAGLLRGTVGAVGLATVLAICLVPFLKLGAHYLIYRSAAALAATVSPGPVSGLIDAIGSAFALMLGMTGGSALILYAALITSIRAVNP